MPSISSVVLHLASRRAWLGCLRHLLTLQPIALSSAWVPTWAFGRPFNAGASTQQLPEHSLALLLGLCTSAPAGPLTSYLGTISRNLPTNFLGNSIHSLASRVAKFWGKQGTEVRTPMAMNLGGHETRSPQCSPTSGQRHATLTAFVSLLYPEWRV